IGAPGSAVRLISKARAAEQVSQAKQLLINARQAKLQSERTAHAKVDPQDKSTVTRLGANANPYDKAFYDAQIPGSEASARAILSLLFKYYKPSSIIDVGCGAGTWL